MLPGSDADAGFSGGPLVHNRRQAMSDDNSDTPKKSPSASPMPRTTKPTGQRRSLERGKSTRKKNPGKRARSGGS